MFRSRSDIEPVTLLVPGRTPAEVADAVARLSGLGRVGPDEQGVTGLLTAAAVGGPDPATWCLLQVDAEGHGFTIGVPDLAEALGVAVDDLRVPSDDERMPDDQRTVLVAPAADREYRPVGRRTLGSAIDVREVDGWHLATWEARRGAERAAYDEAVAQLAARLVEGRERRGVVITTERFHTTVLDVERGRIVGRRHWPLHVWEPAFDPAIREVEPAWEMASAIVADLLPQHADEMFTSWGDDPVRRRSAFRRTAVDLEEVVASLGLPPETVAVLEGRSEVPAGRFEAVLVSELVDGDPAVAPGSLLDRISLVSSPIGVALLVLALVLGRDTVSTPVWWVAVGIGVMSLLDLVGRVWMWRVRRRRAALRADLGAPPAAG